MDERRATTDPGKQEPVSEKGFNIRDGFLLKNETVIGLVTAGIMDEANKEFLHVEEDEAYMSE